MWPWLTIVGTVFLAELGDKTQLATLLYASDGQMSPWMVFAAASVALVLSSAVAVLCGQWVGQVLPVPILRTLAGAGFILIGAFTLWDIWKPS